MTVPASQWEQRALLVPYWLRAVRIGILITVLTVGSLAIELALPGHDAFEVRWYAAILGIGAAGRGLLAILPWPSPFERGVGGGVLLPWSGAGNPLANPSVVATLGPPSASFL